MKTNKYQWIKDLHLMTFVCLGILYLLIFVFLCRIPICILSVCHSYHIFLPPQPCQSWKRRKKESNRNRYLFQIKFNGLGNDSCDVVFCSCEALYCRKSKHTGPASGESPSHAFCSLTCLRTACCRVGMRSPGRSAGLNHSQTLHWTVITLLTGLV